MTTSWTPTTAQDRAALEHELRERLTHAGWHFAQVLPETAAGEWLISIRQEDTGLLLAYTGPTKLEALRRAVGAVETRRTPRTT